MLAVEREKILENHINENGSILISDASKLLDVSEETIRRDLDKMEKKNLLRRVRGGAYKFNINDETEESPYEFRKKIYVEEKKKIAKLCSRIIKVGDIVMLGNSTTELFLAEMLVREKKNITVITDSLEIIIILEKNDSIKVISTGGIYRKKTKSFAGGSVLKNLDRLYANTAFISCTGLSLDFGVTTGLEEEAEIRKKMIENSRKSYLVADSTKFDIIALHSLCSIEQLRGIITEGELSEEWKEKLDRLNVEIINV